MKSRSSSASLLILLTLVVGFLFVQRGSSAWKLWNIPTLQPPFADTRIITASAESYRLGFDPEIENPRDPFGRLFNLPAPWKLFFLTAIDLDDTNLLAGFLIGTFIAGLFLFLGRVSLHNGWLAAMCAISPPVMLAIERGNVDLFIFLFCAFALLGTERSVIQPIVWLLAASGLKVFPIFGLPTILAFDRRTFLNATLTLVIAMIVFIAVDFSSVRNVYSNTEVGSDFSYGANVFALHVASLEISTFVNSTATLLAYALVMILAVVAICYGVRTADFLDSDSNLQIAGFRLGAGLYIGTFILGNNWDYRLIFLLFTLPQLFEWSQRNFVARFTLVAVLVSLCYLWLSLFLPFAYALDELANWIAFWGLFYMLIASLPEWMKIEIRPAVTKYIR